MKKINTDELLPLIWFGGLIACLIVGIVCLTIYAVARPECMQ